MSEGSLLEGRGVLRTLSDELKRFDIDRPLVVVDPSVRAAVPAIEDFCRGKACFDGVHPNPSLEHVAVAIDAFRESGADSVIAVGGGSALDLAKSLCALVSAGPDTLAVARGDVPLPDQVPPLIAVPTTSGTGSEATHFAVLWIDGRKHSLADPRLRPALAVLDPALTDGLPASVTASTGLDALCQAAESVWSVGATEDSIEDALEAVRLAVRCLRAAVHEGSPESRDAMMRAAHLAGRAIDRTKTTAPHALSYTMTGSFGVPHGHAVALTFDPVLQWNREIGAEDCMDPRGPKDVLERIARLEQAFGGDSVREMLGDLGLATRLSALGIEASDRAVIGRGVNAPRLANNPRRLTDEAIASILESIA